MEKDQQRKRDEELDKFWDIDSLLPHKKAPHFAKDTETAEIVLEPSASPAPSAQSAPTQQTQTARSIPIPPRKSEADSDAPKPHFIPPHTEDEWKRRPVADEEYEPQNALIRRVRLYRWKTDYRYFEGFVRDAVRLYPVKGVPCARTPFFAYVPQYSQMSRAQLSWYLWWRENLRNDRFLDTDYSYVMLYVYELINLSNKVDAAQTRDLLFAVWRHYRLHYYQLDSYLPEWICDLCLIHRLPPPKDCQGDLLTAVMQHCALKEFYVPTTEENAYVQALLRFCSNYNYKKSKFYTQERSELFDRFICGALNELVQLTRDGNRLFANADMDDSRMARDSYSGALCSYRIKQRIEVDFCSFSRSHELRYLVTDAVKYTENRLRYHCGIRSRLSVYALPPTAKSILDDYLNRHLSEHPQAQALKKHASAESTAYDALYDLPASNFSLQNAAEIEKSSWETTEKLVEAFEESDTAPDTVPLPAFVPPAAPLPFSSAETVAASNPDGLYAALSPYREFLRAVYDGDFKTQTELAKQHKLPLDVLADKINELAANTLGDVVLEESERGYALIEDYVLPLQQQRLLERDKKHE